MKTYKFKMYSNHGNNELHKTIDDHASVWKHCVALQRRYYAIYGKYISKFRLINHIATLKKLPRFAHWNQLPSQAIQDVVARIDKGYKKMFKDRAEGKKLVVRVSNLVANISHSHYFKRGGNFYRAIVSKLANESTAISSPVRFLATQSVAPSSGMPLALSISVS
jgi:hypothetical protein